MGMSGYQMSIFKIVLLSYCMVLTYCNPIHSGNGDAERLYDDLMNGYNSAIRPVGNNSDRLTVKFGLRLSQLIDVNHKLHHLNIHDSGCCLDVDFSDGQKGKNLKNQIMTTNVWVDQEWDDYKLKWDPDEYGGVNKLHVPSEQIWLPDIVLYNNADGNYEVTIMTKAILHADGRVVWKPPAIFKSACEINVEYFPFDEQTCFMKFGSWTYDGYTVDFKHQRQGNNNLIVNGWDLTEFYLSVEWDIISIPARRTEKFYSCCEEPFPDITFNLTMRRKTLFYTVNLIIPCVIISGLSVLVFYLPSDSGEKISLSISILLSLGVFFLLLAEIIPPTSLSVPLLGRYLLFTLILVTLSSMATICVLNVNFRSPATHRMSPWVKHVFLDFLPKALCMRRPDVDPGPRCPGSVSDDKDKRRRSSSSLTDPGPLVVTCHRSGDILSDGSAGSNGSDQMDHMLNEDDLYPSPPLTDQVPDKMTLTRMKGHNIAPFPFLHPANGGMNGGNHIMVPTLPAYNTVVPNDGIQGMEDPANEGEDSLFTSFIDRRRQEMEHALLSVRFVAQHMENLDSFYEVEDDWKFVALVLDRLFLWIFMVACLAGTAIIIMQAPMIYDSREPVDIIMSKVGRKMRHLPPM